MSGTSLDGLDLAYCRFSQVKNKWHYEIVHATCIHYSDDFRKWLSNIENGSALDIARADAELGVFIGKKIKAFAKKHQLSVNFVASHGHTIFHQPANGFTTQIGNGAYIAANSGNTTICDFRSLDVALQGQGAPLVPIGDQYLFGDYDYCLNLGGFANVSFEKGYSRIAFDICPVNIVLNALSKQMGKEFDKNGAIARKGTIDDELLHQLNSLKFYKQQAPKSLGKEWVNANIFPLLAATQISTSDKIATYCEHVAMQIAKVSGEQTRAKKATILCSGGGAYNDYLMERIQNHNKNSIVLPDKMIIEYKEALVFAFLGVLRMIGQENCLRSVTGAKADNVGGCIYLS